MHRFELQRLRDIADEGIARHGLRGYARKLGLDVSTMRSLRDGRDMQISKLVEIVAAMDLNLMLGSSPGDVTPPVQRTASDVGAAKNGDLVVIPYHPRAPQNSGGYCGLPLAFNAHWLAQAGWDADTLRIVAAPAASGAASGTQGPQAIALHLLDCAAQWPTDHALWAYLEGGAIRIGYLSRPASGMLIQSTKDAASGPRLLSGAELDRIEPLGRVVWTGAPTLDRANA